MMVELVSVSLNAPFMSTLSKHLFQTSTFLFLQAWWLHGSANIGLHLILTTPLPISLDSEL